MKLLYCKECGDIFNLKFVEKTCGCGKTRGQYVTQRQAVADGPAVAIGMGSGSLHQALEQAQVYRNMDDPDMKFTRKKYQNDCQILTWARPMTGPGNPNTMTYEHWEAIREEPKTVTFQEVARRAGDQDEGKH